MPIAELAIFVRINATILSQKVKKNYGEGAQTPLLGRGTPPPQTLLPRCLRAAAPRSIFANFPQLFFHNSHTEHTHQERRMTALNRLPTRKIHPPLS